MTVRRSILTAMLVAAPRAALACPVCFGQNDSPMAAGINMGIWLMLGVTGVVLTAFASFFISLIRRARLAAALEADGQAGLMAAGADRLPNPQEGTAQC